MKQGRIALIGAVIVVFVIVLIAVGIRGEGQEQKTVPPPAPVLSVAMTRAQVSTLPDRIPATGNIAAWQEASVGTEVEGLRLTEVKVNVGDRVRRGQILALFKPDMVAADLAEAQASVAQAEAQAMEGQCPTRKRPGYLGRDVRLAGQSVCRWSKHGPGQAGCRAGDREAKPIATGADPYAMPNDHRRTKVSLRDASAGDLITTVRPD